MRSSEKNAVEAFISKAMRERYNCAPYPLPEVVFVAQFEGQLVGVMTIVAGEEGSLLPIEVAFRLDYGTFPVKFNRTQYVQFGRWVAGVPDVAEALVYAATLYAIDRGYVRAIGEIKQAVFGRFSKMGIKPVRISGTVEIDTVPIDVRPYYLCSPAPFPAVILLSDAKKALQDKWKGLVVHE